MWCRCCRCPQGNLVMIIETKRVKSIPITEIESCVIPDFTEEQNSQVLVPADQEAS